MVIWLPVPMNFEDDDALPINKYRKHILYPEEIYAGD